MEEFLLKANIEDEREFYAGPMEARRELLVKHFDEQIARKGEGAVPYDLPV